MTDLVNILKSQSIGCNKPLSEAQIKIANIKLKQCGLPEVPSDFVTILNESNGFSNEGALVFGIETASNFFEDLVSFNQKFFHNQSASKLILGYDECFYLLYEDKDKTYKIVDKDTLEEENSCAVPDGLVCFLLRAEY